MLALALSRYLPAGVMEDDQPMLDAIRASQYATYWP